MSDAWRVASIKSFEQVAVAPTTALLRVSAASAFRSHRDDERPTLVADDGVSVSRFACLPAPPDESGLLRCAYSVGSEVLRADAVFSLEFADDFVIALPAPTPGSMRLNQRGGPPPASDAHATAAGAERRSELAPKLTELSEELAGVRREAGELRDEAELGRLSRAEILHLHLEAIETRAELRALRELAAYSESLVGEHASGSAQLAETRAALVDAEQRSSDALARAEADARQLAAERSQLEELRARLSRFERDAREAAERMVAAEQALEQATFAREEAEAAVAPLRAEHERSTREAGELRDQVSKLESERAELTRQLAAFDDVSVRARERAAEAEAERASSKARLGDLETWTAELERRLAETTTQLGEARAAAQHDQDELQRLRAELAAAQAHADSTDAAGAASRDVGGLWESAVRDAHRQAERDLADASA